MRKLGEWFEEDATRRLHPVAGFGRLGQPQLACAQHLVAGRQHERVHAEGGDAERLADLAEARPVAELVEG